MKNIFIVSTVTLLLVISGCAHKDREYIKSQEYVDDLCRAAANRIPRPENMTILPNRTYSDCMVEHGYIEKLGSL